MSTAAKFTVRDLSRRTAAVLEAVRKFGQVEICSRTGEVMTLAPKKGRRKAPSPRELGVEFLRRSEERTQRFREMGFVPPPESELDRINRIIAGEE